MFKQGTSLTVRESFEFKNPATGRKVTFKAGSAAWVSSCNTEQANGTAEVCRKGQPKGAGYTMAHADICKLFEVNG